MSVISELFGRYANQVLEMTDHVLLELSEEALLEIDARIKSRIDTIETIAEFQPGYKAQEQHQLLVMLKIVEICLMRLQYRQIAATGEGGDV